MHTFVFAGVNNLARRSPKFQGNKKNQGGKTAGKMRSSEYHRTAMLDIRRENSFNYYLTKIFEDAGLSEETFATHIANITTKGSRVSLKEAKDYAKRMQDENKIEERTCKEILQLLDRYRKWR